MEENNKDINSQGMNLDNSMFSQSSDGLDDDFSDIFGDMGAPPQPDAPENTQEETKEAEIETIKETSEENQAEQNVETVQENDLSGSFDAEKLLEEIEEEAEIEENQEIESQIQIEETQTQDFQDDFTSQNKSIRPIVETFDEDMEISSQSDSMITVRPVKFQKFDEVKSNLSLKRNLDIMQDIPMNISVELGKTKSTIRDIINMEVGSVVELDKIAGEQVEVYVNEKLVARGEVIVIEDRFGVRIVSTSVAKESE